MDLLGQYLQKEISLNMNEEYLCELIGGRFAHDFTASMTEDKLYEGKPIPITTSRDMDFTENGFMGRDQYRRKIIIKDTSCSLADCFGSKDENIKVDLVIKKEKHIYTLFGEAIIRGIYIVISDALIEVHEEVNGQPPYKYVSGAFIYNRVCSVDIGKTQVDTDTIRAGHTYTSHRNHQRYFTNIERPPVFQMSGSPDPRSFSRYNNIVTVHNNSPASMLDTERLEE